MTKSKRFKKLSRKRDYGLVILINKFKKQIQKAAYNRKLLEKKAKDLWKRTQNREPIDPLLLDYLIPEKKIEFFMKQVNKLFSSAFNKSGKKIMTLSGKKLDMKKPDYTSAIEQMNNRGLELAKGLVEEQKTKIKKILQKGFEEGLTYSEVSKNMISEVKSMSESRAKLISSTEMNLAVNRGMQQTMEHNNINHYHYVTAGDNRVAEICNMNSKGTRDGSGKLLVHTVGKGPMPVKDSHPRCRCVIVKARE